VNVAALAGSARPTLPWWAGRAAVLAIVVTAAYWLSLASLWRDLSGQTPLSFVGLAPLLAFGLLVAGLSRREPLPGPGGIDLVAGLALIAAAAGVLVFGPTIAAVYFWTARLDLATLPLFAAGSLIILFGWRALFVARGALFLTFLAWPLPYLVLLENTTTLLTDLTASGLTALVTFVPVATPTGGEAVFRVNAADPFVVQVAAACAGLNSTVAFLLVGSAFAIFMNGPAPRKIVWLGVGLSVVFGFNLVRVMLLVVVGAIAGEAAAIDLFHPVAGMMALVLALGVMLRLLPRFGMTMPDLRVAPPLAAPLPARSRAGRPAATAVRLATLGALALPLALVNSTFAAFDAPMNGNAAVALPLSASADEIGRWTVRSADDIPWAKPYYGDDSRWTRFRLSAPPGTPSADTVAVWMDDVVVPDRQRLTDFGIEKCYRFHGHSIDAAESISLGHGIVGKVAAVTRTNSSQWLVLWWEWPVDRGGRVWHERITLLAHASARPSAGQERTPAALLLFQNGAALPDELAPLANRLSLLASGIVDEQSSALVAAR
jgi:exosortase/archaeosortase family protein